MGGPAETAETDGVSQCAQRDPRGLPVLHAARRSYFVSLPVPPLFITPRDSSFRLSASYQLCCDSSFYLRMFETQLIFSHPREKLKKKKTCIRANDSLQM